MDAFKVSEANLVVYIHPSKANNVSKAILHELSSMLFKFSEVFDGVVLAYKKSTHSSDAKILPGIHPYFGVRLKAELLLFSPKPGMLLEGKVVKLGKESIHVVILDFCSACITEQDVREEFRYTIKHGEDVYVSKSHRQHVIKVGSMIRFSFKSMDEEILHIAGSLSPSNTGNIRWLEKHAEEGPESERSCKRKNENQGDIQMHDIKSFDGVACQIENNGLLSKSSKRRRSNEGNGVDSQSFVV